MHRYIYFGFFGNGSKAGLLEKMKNPFFWHLGYVEYDTLCFEFFTFWIKIFYNKEFYLSLKKYKIDNSENFLLNQIPQSQKKVKMTLYFLISKISFMSIIKLKEFFVLDLESRKNG